MEMGIKSFDSHFDSIEIFNRHMNMDSAVTSVIHLPPREVILPEWNDYIGFWYLLILGLDIHDPYALTII